MGRESVWRRILLLGLKWKDLTQIPRNLLMGENPSIEQETKASCDDHEHGS